MEQGLDLNTEVRLFVYNIISYSMTDCEVLRYHRISKEKVQTYSLSSKLSFG